MTEEVLETITIVRIDPKSIPSMEKKLLCATFLDAVVRFYKDPNNELAFQKWCAEKGENAHGSKDG